MALSADTGRAPIRVLVVDDHEVVRRGFVMLVEQEEGMEVVGQACRAEEAVELATSLAPDVVLLDYQLPDFDGIEAARRILAATAARVVMLTALSDDDVVHEGLRAGVSGFLLKVAPAEELLHAITLAAEGKAHLDANVTLGVIDRFRAAPVTAARSDLLERLTERERDVLVLVAQGQSNAEIAESLHLSETTVKSHISHILTKTGLRDRSQAVGLAYESGLVTPGL